MTRSITLYLKDILRAINEIEEFMKDMPYDDFSQDIKAIRAVTMNFIIIGEPSKQIPRETRAQYDIPWTKIIGMRNILTNDYPQTDVEIVWKTAKNRLPALKEAVDALMENENSKKRVKLGKE